MTAAPFHPGIDLASRLDSSLLADPLARSKVYQGVTTEVGVNFGHHAAPIVGGVATEREAEYAASMALSATWRTSSEDLGRVGLCTSSADLPEAIRKIARLPSQRAGFVDRGLIGEGMHADLVLLEPATLSASVGYESPVRYPRGVHTVLVNGVVVIDAGLHTGARPGALLGRTR